MVSEMSSQAFMINESVNHYNWLRKHLPKFLDEVGVRGGWDWNQGIIVAHGDKGYGFRTEWANAGIPFPHAMAVYLLTYCAPFSEESRETKHGWVDPGEWVLGNYERFKQFLPEVDLNDPDIESIQAKLRKSHTL